MKEIKLINTAFGQGTESKEGASYDVYTGIAPFHLLAINPTLEELKKIYPERDEIQEPDYSFSRQEDDGSTTTGTWINVYLKTNVEHREANGIEAIMRAGYLLLNRPRTNTAGDKVQVINPYGETGWLTKEQFDNKELPQYMVNNKFVTEGMRPAYDGEEGLIDFLKAYIGIPRCTTYNSKDRTWTLKTGADLEAAKAGFSVADIKRIIGGDVSVIRNAVSFQPNNQIKFLTGVRTTDEGREYQDIYSRHPIRFNTRNYNAVEKDIANAQDAGAYPNTYFGESPYPFKKHEVVATKFEPADNPFAVEGEGDDAPNPFAEF